MQCYECGNTAELSELVFSEWILFHLALSLVFKGTLENTTVLCRNAKNLH